MMTVALGSLLMLQQGCSRQTAPDPPRSRSRLTLELFEALQSRDHGTALAKLERLRSIDDTNLYLANLHNMEIENIAILEAEKELENYEPQKAVEILEKAMKSYKQSEALLNAKAQVFSMMELSSCIRELKRPSSSIAMKKAALSLNKMSESDKSLKIFNSFIRECVDNAFNLEKSEREKALSSLACDIRANAAEGGRITPYMLAELAVESPKDSLLIEYTDFLKQKDSAGTFSKIIQE